MRTDSSPRGVAMLAISLIGGLGFVVLSAVLGIRLLRLARRTRRLPELAMGIAFLASGALGAVFTGLGRAPLPAPAPEIFAACGKLAIHLGVGCQLLFTWRVFRPGSGWARAAFVGYVLCAATTSGGLAVAGELGNPNYLGAWAAAEVLLQMAGLGWASGEALHYWGMLRRRLRLGLAERLEVNRFLLWGVAVAAGVAALAVRWLPVMAGAGDRMERSFLSLGTTIALISALGYWFTFFPPAFYRRRLSEADAAAGARVS